MSEDHQVMYQPRRGPAECSICYRPADGYHYDVASCKACKTFFRRMCLSKVETACKRDEKCFASLKKGNVNIRCQTCRYNKCVKVGMNALALVLSREEKQALISKSAMINTKTVLVKSKDLVASNVINLLTYTEARLEIFRLSSYNPSYVDLGNLCDLIQCSSRISMGEKYGPMPGWPLQKKTPPPTEVPLKSMMRGLPEEQPPILTDKKEWMLFNTFTTIEYAKTFSFFHQFSIEDKLILTGHAILICMYLHMAYFAVSRKVNGCLQPDGEESPQKDEGHYGLTTMPFAPLIRLKVQHTEYVLLKAICFCNPTIHGLSEHAQSILIQGRQQYAEILLDNCFKTHPNRPDRFTQLLGIIPVLELQQQNSKNHYVLYGAPILAKYKKIVRFLHDIMFS